MGVDEIYNFLKLQQAPQRLIKHHQLVLEAAEEIITGLKDNFSTLNCDYQLVLKGAAIHDAGKIVFPGEIDGSGNKHEIEGEQYLINSGIPKDIARFARTHAHWQDPQNTIEDLLVALADTLWKGCRNQNLEDLVIKYIAKNIQKDFWDVFISADSLFEQVSDRGAERLGRSV